MQSRKTRLVATSVVALVLATLGSGSLEAGQSLEAGLSGEYVEARTCDMFSAPCFANGEGNTRGDHAVMAWAIDKGSWNGVKLDGLRIAASIDSEGTLGTPSQGKIRTVIFVDERASETQGKALLAMARKLAPECTRDIIKIHQKKISFSRDGGRVRLEVGKVIEVETRALNLHCDTVCGNEEQFYPVLAATSQAHCVKTVTHTYQGNDLGVRWKDPDTRGSMIGRFDLQLDAS